MRDEAIIIYIDGSSRGNPGRAGIGFVVFSKDDPQKPLVEISRNIGITTNNVAEYEALFSALKWLSNNQIKKAEIRMDSELVYKQITGIYRVKEPPLVDLKKRVVNLMSRFEDINFKIIPRKENKLANRLAQKAAKAK